MILKSDLFWIFKENLQKPKKKKEETNGTTETKLIGKEAKPKKTKTKKNDDVSEEGSPAIQSEKLWRVYAFPVKNCDLDFIGLTLFPYRWKEGEEKEARKR